MNKYLIEFIGTFFLVLTLALTANPIAVGAVLAAMVYMGGYISGGHYNPAVTLAVLIRGKIKMQEAVNYFIVQVLGAFVASFSYFLITSKIFIPKPNPSFSLLATGLVEFLFTFLLAFVVLHVATSEKNKGNQYFGLAIGLALLVGGFAGGKISGAVYNPAIAAGSMLFDFANLAIYLPTLVLYLGMQLLGGLLAGLVYKATS
ncbi:aquaporin [Candidatus Gottesmanbacteria bacterium]|nr:aquaporin [Candidatus Gottesmanbacteria bacterium]